MLESMCRDERLATQSIAGAVLGLIKSSAAFAALCTGVNSPDFGRAVQALMSDPLLRAALPRIVVADAECEDALCRARRFMLNDCFSGASPRTIWSPCA